METFFITVLNSAFLNCKYGHYTIIDKFVQLTGNKYVYTEYVKNKNTKIINVYKKENISDNDEYVFSIIFELNDNSYITNISFINTEAK